MCVFLQVADLTRAKAIVVFTLGGTTVIRSSKGRPHIPVIAVTPKVKTARTLQLYWGVYPIVGTSAARALLSCVCVWMDEWMVCLDGTRVWLFCLSFYLSEEDTDTLEQSIDHMFEKGCEVARQEGICQSPDDLLVITAGKAAHTHTHTHTHGPPATHKHFSFPGRVCTGLPFGTQGATNILRYPSQSLECNIR